MTLRFTDAGFRAVPRPQGAWGRFLDVALGDAACAVSLAVAVVAGGFAAHQAENDQFEIAAMLGLVAAPFALVVLTRVVVEVVGHAVLLVMFLGAVLFSPLLLFPGVRRRARRWWKKEPTGPLNLDRLIPVCDLEPVSVDRTGRRVTVTVLVDGRPVAYEARDGAGERLEGEFRALLSAPRPATGVGP
ncbi:hypothetical protein GCM10009557_28770 [Virgisporangium ochraceum]|uniref:Uncharacterized protein n=1 Tax=Virgisporangium ochraceum TaxID=65505 RepID=A0A8J4A433_9ACTN|nr:hypothetical protein Voc01_096930 [Virgisporangium ochraceum]